MNPLIPIAAALFYGHSLEQDDKERRYQKQIENLKSDIDDLTDTLKERENTLAQESKKEPCLTYYGVVATGEWLISEKKGQPCNYSFKYGFNYDFRPSIEIDTYSAQPIFCTEEQAARFIDTITNEDPEWFKSTKEVCHIDTESLRIVPVTKDCWCDDWNTVRINN